LNHQLLVYRLQQNWWYRSKSFHQPIGRKEWCSTRVKPRVRVHCQHPQANYVCKSSILDRRKHVLRAPGFGPHQRRMLLQHYDFRSIHSELVISDSYGDRNALAAGENSDSTSHKDKCSEILYLPVSQITHTKSILISRGRYFLQSLSVISFLELPRSDKLGHKVFKPRTDNVETASHIAPIL
jgi:hypothetical protein